MRTYDVTYSRAAARDIEALRERIEATSGGLVADTFIGQLLDYIDSLSVAPKRGSSRSDIRPGVRIIGWRRISSIAFLVEPTRVVIIAVAYGGRDIEALLKQRLPQLKKQR